MKVISTRDSGLKLPLSEAILLGLAKDGGLFVPTVWPQDLENFSCENFHDYAYRALAPYFKDDALEDELPDFIQGAFNFPLKLNFYAEEHALLELFHGPTHAFKDFGARFLAQVLSSIGQKTGELTILVATSGDTGGAVAAAFHDRPGIKVVILYPKDRVSPLQEQQLTCWGNNIKSLRVDGSFDDCQRLVKEALQDPIFNKSHRTTSANSINIGRLLPQMAYHGFSASLFYQQVGKRPNLVIPSGNLGNAFAAFWAKKMAAPIENILMASNANNTIPEYLASGTYRAQKPIATLANAMDVGDPSNMQRLLHLIPEIENLRKISGAVSVNDSEINAEIARFYTQYQNMICPHTAVATFAAHKIFQDLPYLVSATAHPAKFLEVIEPILQQKIPLPTNLAKLLTKESKVLDIPPSLAALLENI